MLRILWAFKYHFSHQKKNDCKGSSRDHTYIQSKVKPEIFVQQGNVSVNKRISYFDKVFIIPYTTR